MCYHFLKLIMQVIFLVSFIKHLALVRQIRLFTVSLRFGSIVVISDFLHYSSSVRFVDQVLKVLFRDEFAFQSPQVV